jgi:AIPR protein
VRPGDEYPAAHDIAEMLFQEQLRARRRAGEPLRKGSRAWQYQVAKSNAATTPGRRRRFNEQTPTWRKFTKADLAKCENSWRQRLHEVSLGAQKNFDRFMQNLRDRHPADWLPDEIYYKQLIAKVILFKAIDRIVRREGFPAYQANIKTYLMAYVAFRSASQLDLDAIWNEQGISDEIEELLCSWSREIDRAIVGGTPPRRSHSARRPPPFGRSCPRGRAPPAGAGCHPLSGCTVVAMATPGTGQASALPSTTRGGSWMRECRTSGSVRGALSNARPYRDY